MSSIIMLLLNVEEDWNVKNKTTDLTRFRLRNNPVNYKIKFHHDSSGFWFNVYDIERNGENKSRIAEDIGKVVDKLLEPDKFDEYTLFLSHDQDGLKFWIEGVELTQENKVKLADDLRHAARSLLSD